MNKAKKPAVKSKAAAAPKKPKAPMQSGPARPMTPEEAAAAAAKPIKGMPQTPRGMRDIVPSEQKYWRHVYRKAEELTAAYGYERMDTPILEETNLFVRTAGKSSDVVEKEMFSFIDKGGENVTMRPEGTAPLVRAYVNHGMVNLPQPVKMYYWGPMFRYERPQQGRFRQHTQFGVEVFGDPSPVQDCEIILLAYLFYKELGIKTSININSLGCSNADCRPKYMMELTNYYRSKRSQLCEDCKRRLAKNPLRLLDCKEASCQPIKESAPHTVDFLDEECKNHLMRVLEYLDDLQVPYFVNPQLVRGFDYYNRTVFEIMVAEENPEQAQIALGGGGRYDGLVEQLGGRPTPACGFGIGIERVILQMKAQGVEPKDDRRPDIFLAQLGDAARRKAFMLFEDLRASGVLAAANFSKGALKGQLEIANRLGAKYTVILGQKEVIDGTVLIRDMESGMQEIVLYDKAGTEIKKKLGKT